MAVTTVTSTTALLGAPLIHAGLNSASAKLLHSGTFGDILFMMRIPTGVDIVSVHGKITTAATNANGTVGVQGGGLGSAAAAAFGSLASGALPVFPVIPANNYRVSLSDDATPRYTYLVVSPTTATWTATATVDITVFYKAK